MRFQSAALATASFAAALISAALASRSPTRTGSKEAVVAATQPAAVRERGGWLKEGGCGVCSCLPTVKLQGFGVELDGQWQPAGQAGRQPRRQSCELG